jgi:hypothetical protein
VDWNNLENPWVRAAWVCLAVLLVLIVFGISAAVVLTIAFFTGLVDIAQWFIHAIIWLLQARGHLL